VRIKLLKAVENTIIARLLCLLKTPKIPGLGCPIVCIPETFGSIAISLDIWVPLCKDWCGPAIDIFGPAIDEFGPPIDILGPDAEELG
jgi:hypothetical protein